MSKKFKPMLLPNNTIPPDKPIDASNGGLDFENLNSETYYASFKRDGVRAIIKDGKLLTRSLKKFENQYLEEIFGELLDISKEDDVIIEGELYHEGYTFDEISGIVRSKDTVPYGIKFYGFDCITDKNYDEPFVDRYVQLLSISTEHFVPIQQQIVTPYGARRLFEVAIDNDFEGLVLRHPHKGYKCGRLTLNEDSGFKMKNIMSIDTPIIGFQEQMTNTSESFVNELGHKTKHKKKKDLKGNGKLGAFLVTFNNKVQKVNPAMTDTEKLDVWKNQEKFLGRWIEVKGMTSSKGMIRHPTFHRWRTDLDES